MFGSGAAVAVLAFAVLVGVQPPSQASTDTAAVTTEGPCASAWTSPVYGPSVALLWGETTQAQDGTVAVTVAVKDGCGIADFVAMLEQNSGGTLQITSGIIDDTSGNAAVDAVKIGMMSVATTSGQRAAIEGAVKQVGKGPFTDGTNFQVAWTPAPPADSESPTG